MYSSEKEKKKKKNLETETWVAVREAWVSRGRAVAWVSRNLGRIATWVWYVLGCAAT